jgi:hypothetical protein
MWGDDPEDYKKLVRNELGLWSVALPTCHRVIDDWYVDMEWIFTASSEYAVACIPTAIRFTGKGFRECSIEIENAAEKTVETLWSRYKENVINRLT